MYSSCSATDLRIVLPAGISPLIYNREGVKGLQALGLLGNAFAEFGESCLYCFDGAGVAIGIIFGSIPGLSASMAVALMLPSTFSMTPSLGMNTLVAVYIGGISGGLISAILLNMPGTASSIATCFDGHPMAKRGEAMKALGLGIVFSALGPIFSFIILTFCAPLLADIALKFTPAENFGICFFALTMVAILSSGNMLRGLLAGLFGLMFTLVGMAPIDGTARFTFGSSNLMAGFDTLPTLIGIFAISDILCTAESMKSGKIETIPIKKVKGFGFSLQEFVYHLPNFFPVCSDWYRYQYSGNWRLYFWYAGLCNSQKYVKASGGVW